MPRFRTWQKSVEAGELHPEYALRTDSTIRNNGLLKARNIKLLSGGGWQRRWGTKYRTTHVGKCRYEAIGLGGEASILFAFSNARLDVYDSNWNLLQSITSGCPWTNSNLDEMTVAAEADKVSVASNDFHPIEIIRENGTWSVISIVFTFGRGNSIKQPYYRFQPRGVTLTASGLTGTVNLVTSDDYFVSGHVGIRIRHQGQEIVVATYVDSTHATGDVVGALYPTINVPLTNTSGFNVGDVVQGEDSKIEGIVTEITNSTNLKVTLTNGYAYFTGGITNEKLVGPSQRSALTAACASATSAPTLDWGEQLISPLRGYPNSVSYHRGRRIFADFPNAANLIAASAINDANDYDVGAADNADAIIQTVGRDGTLRVRFTASMEQLILFTDAGVYYVPETVGAPFSPSNAEFMLIGPEVCGNTPPIKVSEGVLFCEARSGRLFLGQMTGNIRGSWQLIDLSELAFHLMDAPKRIALIPASYNSDREIMVLLENGDIAVMKNSRGKEVAGWTLWQTEGTWDSICVINGKAFLSSTREGAYYGEELSNDCVTDCVKYATNLTWSQYSNKTMFLTKDNRYLSTSILSGLGVASNIDNIWGEIGAGFNYNVEVEYPSPIDGENGQYRLMSICNARIDVIDSGDFAIDNYTLGEIDIDAAEDAIPPLWSEVRKFWVSGWHDDPTIKITQEIPNPLNVRALTMEVKA